MSIKTETKNRKDIFNKYGAFIKGLDFVNPAHISSAAYVCSEIGELPKLKDDYKFKRGRGIISDAVVYCLTFLKREAAVSEYNGFEEYLGQGGVLSEYDNTPELALYLFKEKNQSVHSSRGWENAVADLEEKEETIKEQLREIKEQLSAET